MPSRGRRWLLPLQQCRDRRDAGTTRTQARAACDLRLRRPPECVGIHASRSADRFQALEPVKQAVRQCHGGFAKGIAAGLRLRHDHGSQYVSHDFQAEIRFLGLESSPAFVREPEGNGCAERFIRVLKENLLWVRRFDTVEELRLALLAFRQTYNQSWIIERHGYKTPAQVRAEQTTALPMAA